MESRKKPENSIYFLAAQNGIFSIRLPLEGAGTGIRCLKEQRELTKEALNKSDFGDKWLNYRFFIAKTT